MKHMVIKSTAAALALVAPAQVQAATFLFELSGSNTATFELDDAALELIIADGFGFLAEEFTFNGELVTGDIFFYTTLRLGGFDFEFDDAELVFTGPQLFDGLNTDPTFVTGTFQLDNGDQIAISAVNAAVPEPSTWALMLLGFGAVGGAMRAARRATPAKVTYA